MTGSYARFEHYLTTLEVETCPEFCPTVRPCVGHTCLPAPRVWEWASRVNLILTPARLLRGPHSGPGAWRLVHAALRGPRSRRSHVAGKSSKTAAKSRPLRGEVPAGWTQCWPRCVCAACIVRRAGIRADIHEYRPSFSTRSSLSSPHFPRPFECLPNTDADLFSLSLSPLAHSGPEDRRPKPWARLHPLSR